MSGGLSNLGTALTVVFVVSLVAISTELIYVLWRRRRLLRQQPTAVVNSPAADFALGYYSKELLYFLCLKSHSSQVEPNNAPTLASGTNGSSPESRVEVEVEVEVIDVFRLQNLYGPSRVLFTIKEEEREDLESEKSLPASTEKALKDAKTGCVEVTGDSPEEVVGMELDDNEMTPLSTPCGSPLYFTPVASPARLNVESSQKREIEAETTPSQWLIPTSCAAPAIDVQFE